MAKRYGRNQRRKHREQIAALEGTLGAKDDIHRKELRQLFRELDRVRSLIVAWDNDVRELVGRYSAFVIETLRVPGEHAFVLPLFERLRAYAPLHPDFMSTNAVIDRMETLRCLLQFDACQTDLRYMVRFVQVDRYEKEYLHLCYAVPQMELMRMGGRDYTFLAKSISEQFKSFIENDGRDGVRNIKEFRP
ncbi:hypothetical protein ACRRRS_21820 (plasmid) [Brucella anthropi]|uniref:hypothetical protein n=1 Tax=Brucella anthropi TaxID=529 RepID=UPI003D7EA4D9